MSLEFAAITNGPATCAVQAADKIAVGFSSGAVRVFSADDHVLEREIPLGNVVTKIVHIPRTDLIAVICDSRCTIHDLATRKMVAEVDSRSAKFITATLSSSHTRVQESILVVGSSYKIRLLRFANSRLVNTTVIDVPDRQKLRVLGNAQESGAYAVVGSKPTALWHLSLISSQFRPILALDPAVFTKSAREFVVTGTADCLLLGCSSGAQLVRLKPLQIVRSWKNSSTTCAATLKSSPLGLEVILMVVKPQAGSHQQPARNEKPLLLINPMSGSILSRYPEIELFGGDSYFGLREPSAVVQLKLEITIDYIVNMKESSEAALLAFRLPPDAVTEQLREIERNEATKLFRDGDIDEALRQFLQIEQQENDGIFKTHEYVIKLLQPYLDELYMEDASGSTPSSENQSVNGNHILSSQHSTFSAKTSANNTRHHFLDPVVSYLLFTRRKLRLAHHNDSSASEIDTALFKSYIIMKSPLVMPLLRSANLCDSTTVKEILLAKGKWRELVFFLRSRDQLQYHQQALDLLVEHNDPPESIVSYLERIPMTSGDALDLVFEYAKPALTQDPNLAYRLFFEEKTSSSEAVYRYLAGISDELSHSFAKYRVFQFGDQTPALHNIVATILANNKDAEPQLLEFLRTSEHIEPETLLTVESIPPRGRAVLLERLGAYIKAVDLYLDDMGDLAAAQALAEKYSCATYLFDKLVGLTRTESKSCDKANDWLFRFLNASSTTTDLKLAHVLSKIPDSISAQSIGTFLKKFIADDISKDRDAEVREALSRTALTEYSIHLSDHRKRKFSVDSSDACCVCHKRIGKAVTGVINGELVHYACMKLL